jgi:septum formation protein
MLEQLQQYHLILASQSPRRRMLFEDLGFPFEVRSIDVDESFPDHLQGGEIPAYLAAKKAAAVRSTLREKDILVTADTVVWINGHALNKPADRAEAKAMLLEIAGATHSVFTGVCISTKNKQHTFFEETKVHFNPLSKAEITHYLDRYKPFDKAGAYGIQEFIGLIGIKAIEGDFYNVVGFPMQSFWKALQGFIDEGADSLIHR